MHSILRSTSVLLGTVLGLGLGSPLAALAQTDPPTAQPSGPLIIDQGRSDRAPPAAPELRGPLPPAEPTPPPPPAGVQPFTITAVRLEGGSLPRALMDDVFRPFIGQRTDTQGLARLSQAAAAAYGRSDIALYTVLVPNQTFGGGVVRLRAIEGHLVGVTVKDAGAGAGDAWLARRYAKDALQERPLHASTLQRAILLMRSLPGVTADVRLLRGAGDGDVELAVDLKRRPYEVGVGVNDQGTSELGRTQVELDLTFNSLLRAGEQTRFTVAVPTDVKRFQYYSVAQTEALGDQGLTATANIGYLRTSPASIPTQGSAVTAGVALSYPVFRTTLQTLTATASVDGVNSDNALFGQRLSNDHTRAARLAAAYTRTRKRLTVALSATASFGLDAFGAEVTNPVLSDKTFVKVNGRAGVDFRATAEWTLRLRAIGQFTSDRLPAVEEIPLGGQEFGRAFDAQTILGDEGAAGSAEIAFAPKGLPSLLKGSEIYAFTDRGEVWQQSRFPLIEPGSQGLGSAGVGARLAVASKSVLQVEAAKAVQEPVPGASDGWRVTFSVRSAY